MRRECENSVLAYVGHGRDIPGFLFQLHHPDGCDAREFLFDSWLEAQTFAAYFGASLSTEVPAEVSPLRAIDPSRTMEQTAVMLLGHGEGTVSRKSFAFDHLRAEDFRGLLASGGNS